MGNEVAPISSSVEDRSKGSSGWWAGISSVMGGGAGRLRLLSFIFLVARELERGILVEMFLFLGNFCKFVRQYLMKFEFLVAEF